MRNGWKKKGKVVPYIIFEHQMSFLNWWKIEILKPSKMALNQLIPLHKLYEKFYDRIRKGNLGPMARFWQSYLDMVQVFLDIVKSTRLQSWDLHFQRHRKNPGMDPRLRPCKLLKIFHLFLGESAKTCNKTSFDISRISEREFCC